MNICMIGAGYVGLVSAACFSEFGWTVSCVDKDPSKIDRASPGWRADLRAAPRRSSARAICAGAHHVLLGSRRLGRRRRSRVSRRRHADAPRRRPCRSQLSSFRRSRSWRRISRASPSSAPNRRCRSAPAARSSGVSGASSRRRFRGLLQSGILARRLRHLRLHASGPRAGRLRQRAARRTSWSGSTSRLPCAMRRSCS